MKRPITFGDDERVLLVASGGLGNVLQFTPALRALKHEHPGLRVDLLAALPSNGAVMESNPHLDEVIYHTKTFHFHPGDRSEARDHLPDDQRMVTKLAARGYDTSINIYPILGLRPASFIRNFGAPRRVGTRLVNPLYRWMTRRYYTHIVDLAPGQHGIDIGFAHVGMSPEGRDHDMELVVPKEEAAAARRLLAKGGIGKEHTIVGIHPGCIAANKEKRWPLPGFASVAKWLMERPRFRVLIFLGPDELDMEEPLKEALRGSPESYLIVKDMGLSQVAALIGRCRLFISNDSGLMHMASAAGVPTLAIFGPTDPRRYRTRGPRDRQLHAELNCSGCYGTQRMKECERRKCLESITAGQVKKTVKEMLKSRRSR